MTQIYLTFIIIIKKKKSPAKCLKGCGERELLCIVGRIAIWYNHYGKQYGKFSAFHLKFLI